MSQNDKIIMPTDNSANSLGGNSRGAVQPVIGATDSSAEMLGKGGNICGAMGGASVTPPAMSPTGSAPGAPSAAGPNAAKLKGAFKGRK
jgi:hypothetical protein